MKLTDRHLSTPARLGLFAAALAAVFAVATVAGSAFEPAGTAAPSHEGEEEHGAVSEDEHGAAGDDEHGEAPAMGGLAVAEEGFSFELDRTELARGRTEQLEFRILDAGGKPVSSFDEIHERRMHLILVRRDGTGYQHLHPRLAGDGTWTVDVELPEAGVYRAFADFSVDDTQHTLAADLSVPGAYDPESFPRPEPVDETGPYRVELAGEAVSAGSASELTFAVSRRGRPVADLEPYLGADGHLVALREGDLAFLHVHPEESGTAPDEVAFAATFPTAGRYRLYLQFKHDGRVRKVEHTVEVPR